MFDDQAGGGELELAADGGVGRVGVGPFGIGGELQPQAALGGLLDEGVAVDAGAAGLADGSGLAGLGIFIGLEGGLEGGFGNVVLAGFLAVFEGEECEQVIRFEGGAADFLGLGEGGELGLVQERGGGAGFRAAGDGGTGGGHYRTDGAGLGRDGSG